MVYVYRNNERKELHTHYCTRTTELLNADADLAYLSKLSEESQALEITGVLADSDKRLRRVSVVARSDGRSYRTTSDEKGWFKLTVPRGGKYRVRVFLPLYADVVGTQDELDRISRRVVTKRRVVLDYDVVVEPGKCAFINPPLFIGWSEHQKHGRAYP